MNNFFLLWRQILKNPRSLGTVAPSSPYLAHNLVRAANLSTEQFVVEVGAGTGPLTDWIYKQVRPEQFAILEPNTQMALALSEKYHEAKVLERFVQELPQVQAELQWPKIDVVLSSLPWSIFPENVLDEGLQAIHTVLAPQGKVLTLVYSHAQYFPSSLKLERKFLEHFENVYRTRTTWRNIPPGYFLVGERPRKPKSVEEK